MLAQATALPTTWVNNQRQDLLTYPGWNLLPGVVVPVLPLQVAKVSTAGAGAPITSQTLVRLPDGLAGSTDEPARKCASHSRSETFAPGCGPMDGTAAGICPGFARASETSRSWGSSGAEQSGWLVRPVKIPTNDAQLDDYLLVDVTALPGSGRGPMIDTRRLWALGAKSGIPWRIWIRLACVWDEVKARNGGNRVYATRPRSNVVTAESSWTDTGNRCWTAAVGQSWTGATNALSKLGVRNAIHRLGEYHY